MPHERHADTTDAVTCLADGEGVRITGFYKILEGQVSPWLGGGTLRYLRNCLPTDPDLAVIGTYAHCGRFHRPWELEWRGPIPWPAEHVANERATWRTDVESFDLAFALKSTGYPQIFERFSPMTNHERMLISEWRRDTDLRIRAHEAALVADTETA